MHKMRNAGIKMHVSNMCVFVYVYVYVCVFTCARCVHIPYNLCYELR